MSDTTARRMTKVLAGVVFGALAAFGSAIVLGQAERHDRGDGVLVYELDPATRT